MRGSLECLFVRGMLGDLPLEQQLHPGMQQRVWRSMPLFDEVTAAVAQRLTSYPEHELRALQADLRPTEGRERLIAALDAEAALTGVSDARRAQTRRLLDEVTWRLAHQPPSLVIGEYVEKVEKVVASDVFVESRRQRLAAALGEQTFWELSRPGARRADAATRWAGAQTLGIDVVHRSTGVAVAASVETVIGAVVVVAATVGVIALLVQLVKAISGSGKKKTAPAPTPPPAPEPSKP
jgi:hypothetical protein